MKLFIAGDLNKKDTEVRLGLKLITEDDDGQAVSVVIVDEDGTDEFAGYLAKFYVNEGKLSLHLEPYVNDEFVNVESKTSHIATD